jgi:PadR family transcriptional regulator PadR
MQVEEVRIVSVDDYCASIETKMRGGLFSVVVLHIIGSASQPPHGYLITKALEDMTNRVIYIQAGTLYPILKNLENNELIKHEMVKSSEGPPRKIYRLTRDGAQALERVIPIMDNLFEAIRKVRDADWQEVLELKTKE